MPWTIRTDPAMRPAQSAAALQHRLGRDSHSVQAGNYTVLRSIQAAGDSG